MLSTFVDKKIHTIKLAIARVFSRKLTDVKNGGTGKTGL
jgi:hypothetical protein